MDSPIKTPVLDWKSCIDPIKGEGGDNDGEEQDFPGWTDQELSAEQSAAWAETLERLQLFDPHHTVMVKKAKTATAAPAAASTSTAAKQAAFKASLPAKSPAAPSPQAAEAAAGLAGRRESREWRPAGRLFLSLQTGWVREVIYKQLPDDSYDMTRTPEIVYHAPLFPGTKPRTFKSSKSIGELNSYLAAKEPTLSYHNFSFHPKVMGAPKDQEKVHGERETVEIFPPPKPAPPPPPQRAKSPKTVPSTAKTPPPSVDSAAPSSGGGLKIKLFSKMSEKNSLQPQSQSDQSDGEPPELEIRRPQPQQRQQQQPKQQGAHPNPLLRGAGAAAAMASRKRPFTAQSSPASAPAAKSVPAGLPAHLTNSPSMTITPISKTKQQKGRQRRSSAVAGSAAEFPQQQQQSSSSPWNGGQPMSGGSSGKPALRPPLRTDISCTIHCPGKNASVKFI